MTKPWDDRLPDILESVSGILNLKEKAKKLKREVLTIIQNKL